MKSTQSKHKAQSKEIATTPEDQLSILLTKTKKNLKYYILAVVCSTAFFVHEFVPVNSKEYVDIVKAHSDSKSDRSNTREQVLESQKGTNLYQKYLEAKTRTDKIWAEVLELQKEEKFLNFKSFQQFLGEFGWAIGLLIYTVFNIVITLLSSKKLISGEIILHSTLLFISIYFINWTILPGDYSKSTYIIFAMIMSTSIVFSVFLLLKAKREYLNHMKSTIHSFFHFLYKDADKNEIIKPEKRIVFRKMRVDLTNKAIGND